MDEPLPGEIGIFRAWGEKSKIDDLEPELKEPIKNRTAKCGRCENPVGEDNAGTLLYEKNHVWVICKDCMFKLKELSPTYSQEIKESCALK